MKTAIITGATGQDGAYLAKLLLEKQYKVIATYRRRSADSFWRFEAMDIMSHPLLHFEELDINDMSACIRLIDSNQPHEIYNLASQSFVETAFRQPVMTSQTNIVGLLNLLESIRMVDLNIRFYQASSSEMFGKVQEIPQTENTVFYPRSPYGVSKLAAHWMVINYRESYNLFGACGISFNHESPLRGKEFVTRKITDAAAKIALGKQDCLELGNLDAQRDWGFAGDYVLGMWQMLQLERPETIVFATNRTESVRNFANMAFNCVDIELVWQGDAEKEIGIDSKTGKTRIKVSQDLYRPAEVDILRGDADKAQKLLGWQAKTSLEELCRTMVNADLQRNTAP